MLEPLANARSKKTKIIADHCTRRNLERAQTSVQALTATRGNAAPKRRSAMQVFPCAKTEKRQRRIRKRAVVTYLVRTRRRRKRPSRNAKSTGKRTARKERDAKFRGRSVWQTLMPFPRAGARTLLLAERTRTARQSRKIRTARKRPAARARRKGKHFCRVRWTP